MKKRFIFIVLGVILIISSFLGCASTTTTSVTTTTTSVATTTTSVTSTTTTEEPFESVTIISCYYGPPKGTTYGYEWWAEQVTNRTGGAVKFEHFYNEALGGSKTAPEDMGAGLYDLAALMPAWYAEKLPTMMLGLLPALTDNPVALGQAMTELVTLVPAFEEEFAANNLKLISFYGNPSTEYMGAKPVYTPEDFDGLLLRSSGDLAKVLASMGTTIISMPSPEVYEAIQRGTVDGATLTYPASFGSYGIYEVAKYATVFGGGPITMPIVMNLAKFNSLDPRVQQIMMEEAAKLPEKYTQIFEEEDAIWFDAFEEAGVEITVFTPEQVKQVRANAGERWDAWIESANEKGLPGQELLDKLLELLEKYGG